MMVIVECGNLLMGALSTRRVTAWLRNACSNTVFIRETRSTKGVIHLSKDGKKKLQLRESNARSKNSVSALKLKPRLTTLITKQRASGKSRKRITKDQAGARFTTMATCTMISLMESSSVKPATSITISSTK